MNGASEWDALIPDLFGAVDAGDIDTLRRLCRIDMCSELVGRSRLQRSRDGFFETVEQLRKDCHGEMHHATSLVCAVGDYAVVDWVRGTSADGVSTQKCDGIREQVEGVVFLRSRVGRLDLFRSYEGRADAEHLRDIR